MLFESLGLWSQFECQYVCRSLPVNYKEAKVKIWQSHLLTLFPRFLGFPGMIADISLQPLGLRNHFINFRGGSFGHGHVLVFSSSGGGQVHAHVVDRYFGSVEGTREGTRLLFSFHSSRSRLLSLFRSTFFCPTIDCPNNEKLARFRCGLRSNLSLERNKAAWIERVMYRLNMHMQIGSISTNYLDRCRVGMCRYICNDI